MMPIGFLPLARPTAREAPALPRASASWPYVRVSAVGDSAQLFPHGALEGRAGEAEFQGELLRLAREVRLELVGRFAEGRQVVAGAEGLLRWAVALVGHVEAAQDAVVGDESEGAVGAVDHGVLLHLLCLRPYTGRKLIG